jgi:hypothetical protein
MAGRREVFHRPFPLAGGLVGIFGPVVQIPRLAVLDGGQHCTVGGTVGAELVGDHHPRYVAQSLQQLAEEPLGGLRVALG